MSKLEEQILLLEFERLLENSGINRRQFLKTSTTLLSSLGIISFLPGCSKNIASTDENSVTLRENESYYLLEATAFYELGGWRLETQFFERLGSAYLLADGSTETAGPSRAKLTIERSGNYQVFVHSNNWDAEWSPGQFNIALNGEVLNKTLGISPSTGWRWEKAGDKYLTTGPIEVALHDLAGGYGRCHAILLTTDPEFVPPRSPAATKDLREKLSTGINTPPPKDLGTYDFVVVGGGVAGSIAALTAARNGLHVALLQNRPVLGGNASDEVGVLVQTAATIHEYARESGLVEELAREARRSSSYPSSSGWQEALGTACAAESNLSLFLNTELTGVMMKSPSQIEGVFATNVLTGEKCVVRGTVFADCTGDADLGTAAGAEYRVGREAKEMYDESFAPSTADRVTLGTSLLYWTQSMPDPQPFTAPSWAHYFDREKLSIVDNFGPFWWVEFGGKNDTINDEEEIKDELLRIVYGIWDYIKNRSPLADIARNYKLVVRPVAGKRESRRLIGDYVLTEGDLKNGTSFDDAVAYGGWPIDLHRPDGFYDPYPDSTTWYQVNLYNIPLRSLYSRNIDNLLMAGRDISVSHVALGSTRIMGTCGVLGQAVGSAAVVCNKHNVIPRAIRPNHIGGLQQILLRDDAYMLGIKNEDPADLARSAKVTASSTKLTNQLTDTAYSPERVISGISRVVDNDLHMWISDPKQLMPQWLNLELPQSALVNFVQITFDTNLKYAAVQNYEPETVKDYEVQVWHADNWLTVARVDGNYQRLRRHRFDAVLAKAVRIIVKATNGVSSARIHEVRIYNQ